MTRKSNAIGPRLAADLDLKLAMQLTSRLRKYALPLYSQPEDNRLQDDLREVEKLTRRVRRNLRQQKRR